MEIRLRTLTPIWTGGVDGTSDRLHESGLIGSLRWWYEAVVRGLGGSACDPSEHRCEFKPEREQYKAALREGKNGPELLRAANLCDACQVFGATSWRRRFRLTVDDSTGKDDMAESWSTTGNRLKRDSQKRPQWYFKTPARHGAFAVSVLPLTVDFDPVLLLGLFKLIEEQAGLGAKTQLGYGWIEEDPSAERTRPAFDPARYVARQQAAIGSPVSPNPGLPALDNMFFAQVKTGHVGLTATLNLKYDVRAMFRTAFSGDRDLRHFVCGSVQGDNRQASKVFYTQAVEGVMRVWGWIPDTLPIKAVQRDDVVETIHKGIANFGTITRWREFNSARDKVTPDMSDRGAFLTSLLPASEVSHDPA